MWTRVTKKEIGLGGVSKITPSLQHVNCIYKKYLGIALYFFFPLIKSSLLPISWSLWLEEVAQSQFAKWSQYQSVVVIQSCQFMTPRNVGPQGPTRLLCPWDFPDKNTGVGCHFFLQGIFPTQGSNWVSCIAGRFFTI